MVFGKHAEEFTSILGKVIVQFTFIEHTCSMITDAITSSSEGTKFFYKVNSAEQRIERFRSLTKNLKTEEAQKFQTFLDRLDEIREKRNFLAHSTYGNLFDENDEIWTTKNGTVKKYSMNEHREIFNQINKLTGDILNFGNPLLVGHVKKKMKKKEGLGS